MVLLYLDLYTQHILTEREHVSCPDNSREPTVRATKRRWIEGC